MSAVQFLARYQRVVEIGEGGFGTVFSAFDIQRGRSVALKEPVIGRGSSAVTRLNALKKEYKNLQALAHPNIVQALDFHDCGDGTAFLVMELCSGGSAASVMKSLCRRFHESIIRRFLREALLGLQYLHEQGVIHRDIKPDNLLLTSEGVLKLADFGLSRDISGSASDPVIKGTIAYVAPEIIKDFNYSEKSDIWALGLSMISLACNNTELWGPVTSKGVFPLLFHIGNITQAPQPPPHLSPALSDILKKMLDINPAMRPSARELLLDKYFTTNEDEVDGMEGMEHYLSSDSAQTDEQLAASSATAQTFCRTTDSDWTKTTTLPPPNQPSEDAAAKKPSQQQVARHQFFYVLGRDVKPYTEEQNEMLNDAFASGKSSVRLKIPRDLDGVLTEYEIDFKKLTQKNMTTGYERKIVSKPPLR